jgi:uncharacterized membrane protein
VSIAIARFLFPPALLLAGGVLSVIAVICHRLSDRLFQNRRYLVYLAVRLSASILFFGALLAIPLALFVIADIFDPGYQLQGDETPGPMGNGGSGSDLFFCFFLILWPLGILAILIYAMVGIFRLLFVETAESARSD